MEIPFLTEVTLQVQVEEYVKNEHLTYLEALLAFCTDNDLDVEDITPVVSSNLKEKIRVDAMNDGLMKRESMLPL